jgi:hypothetical protein
VEAVRRDPRAQNRCLATVDRAARPEAVVGLRARTAEAVEVAASQAADSMRCPQDGWRSGPVRFRGGPLGVGRSGEAAGEDFRPRAPGPGTAVGRRFGRRVRVGGPVGAEPVLAAVGRLVWVARRARGRRNRRAALEVREVWVAQGAPARRSRARSWFPLGQSSRALSAMRHRGRSLRFSSKCRATRVAAFPSINYRASRPLETTVKAHKRLAVSKHKIAGLWRMSGSVETTLGRRRRRSGTRHGTHAARPAHPGRMPFGGGENETQKFAVETSAYGQHICNQAIENRRYNGASIAD